MKPNFDVASGPNVHPACLLAAGLVFLGSLIFVSRTPGFAMMAALWLVAVVGLRVWIIPVLRGLRRVWLFLLLTFVIHLAVSSHVSANWPFVTWGQMGNEAWLPAAFFTGRLILIVSVSIVLFQLHAPQEYGRAFGRVLARMPVFGKRLAQMELIITLALRFVPALEQEFARLRLALAARGQVSSQSRIAQLKTFRKILYPLILNAFRRADQVSLALESRGFDRTVSRTILRGWQLSIPQLSSTVLFSTVCLVSPWL
jgi:energy-coupling factor transport system permease protein